MDIDAAGSGDVRFGRQRLSIGRYDHVGGYRGTTRSLHQDLIGSAIARNFSCTHLLAVATRHLRLGSVQRSRELERHHWLLIYSHDECEVERVAGRRYGERKRVRSGLFPRDLLMLEQPLPGYGLARPRQRRRKNEKNREPRQHALVEPLSVRELLQKSRILGADGAENAQTGIRPFANPIAKVQIRVAGIAVADECFVVASAGAQRSRKATAAIVFCADVAAGEKVALFGAIDAGRDVAERVRIGIDEAVAGRDIARRSDPE